MIKIVETPLVCCVAETKINAEGLPPVVGWVKQNAPSCGVEDANDLWPHMDKVRDVELLVELAGRKCYNSFGKKAGRKSNKEYIAHTQSGDIPHASILYHAKMTFFVANISRRLSHELVRHYVGADRCFEGSPSQESTRYTEFNGTYVRHPSWSKGQMSKITQLLVENFKAYRGYLLANKAQDKRGLERKRVYEAAAGLLNQQATTSLLWTSNPVALAKMFRERSHEAADLEFQRLARDWKALCVARWPNLFGDV